MKILSIFPSISAKTKTAPAYQSIDPNTGKVVKTFDILTDKELEEKLATAALCYEKWRHTSYAERAVIVTKAAQILHDKIGRAHV